jgi:hypothetical protein
MPAPIPKAIGFHTIIAPLVGCWLKGNSIDEQPRISEAIVSEEAARLEPVEFPDGRRRADCGEAANATSSTKPNC